MKLDEVQDISEGSDGEGRSPLVVGQQKRRLPLWVNEDWTSDNNQPLLEDRERDVAYWFDVEAIEKLVDFVKAKS